jgi:hypothetical protein
VSLHVVDKKDGSGAGLVTPAHVRVLVQDRAIKLALLPFAFAWAMMHTIEVVGLSMLCIGPLFYGRLYHTGYDVSQRNEWPDVEWIKGAP